jgi:hypothetical protein
MVNVPPYRPTLRARTHTPPDGDSQVAADVVGGVRVYSLCVVVGGAGMPGPPSLVRAKWTDSTRRGESGSGIEPFYVILF